MKQLHLVGHNVRKGQAVILLGSDSLEPVKFFGEKRAGKVRDIVDRFNRMQAYKNSIQGKNHGT